MSDFKSKPEEASKLTGWIEKTKREIVEKYTKTREMKECLLYAVEGGKNLRTRIGLEVVNNLFSSTNTSPKTLPYTKNKELKALLELSCFYVELVHISSLILDDCPHMDNDLFRRDRPAVHQKFGFAMAQLASFVLIEIAHKMLFEVLEKLRLLPKDLSFPSQTVLSDQGLLALIKRLIKLKEMILGENGLVGGQLYDLCLLSTSPESYERYLKMIEYKTCRLFQASFQLPILLYSALEDVDTHNPILDLKTYERLGYTYGLAFQMSDDLVDQGEDHRGNNITHYRSELEAVEIIIQTISQFTDLAKKIDFDYQTFLTLAGLSIYITKD